MRGKSITIPDADVLRLVRRLAHRWRMSERDVVRIAVWAYVLPLVPSLKAPVDRPDQAPPARRKVALTRR